TNRCRTSASDFRGSALFSEPRFFANREATLISIQKSDAVFSLVKLPAPAAARFTVRRLPEPGRALRVRSRTVPGIVHPGRVTLAVSLHVRALADLVLLRRRRGHKSRRDKKRSPSTHSGRRFRVIRCTLLATICNRCARTYF